jgi:hypothetical protein
VSEDDTARLAAAKVLAVAGVLAYNWWVVVPFVPGLMPSVNGFFSDLEATGRPHAALMSDADLLAGILLTAALLLRGSAVQGVARRERAAGRNLEWHLQLPIHHYIHVVSGIAEFATLTTAAVLAMRRTRNQSTPQATSYRLVVKALVIGYPLLGLAYLTDRLGTLVEPIFFITFTVMVLTEIFEAAGSAPTGLTWAERVSMRRTDADDERAQAPASDGGMAEAKPS